MALVAVAARVVALLAKEVLLGTMECWSSLRAAGCQAEQPPPREAAHAMGVHASVTSLSACPARCEAELPRGPPTACRPVPCPPDTDTALLLPRVKLVAFTPLMLLVWLPGRQAGRPLPQLMPQSGRCQLWYCPRLSVSRQL